MAKEEFLFGGNMNLLNDIDYDWGRKPVTPGFYMAIPISDNSQIVVAYVEKNSKYTGVKSQTGPRSHATFCGNPNAREMHEQYIMWAKIPNPTVEETNE